MGSSEGQTYCLRWNNHKSNLVEILDALNKMESYVDCTIYVDDHAQFKAHRVVLAANSPYFQSILQDVPMDHCSILFPGVAPFEMKALLEYMYTGAVNVTQSQIPRIMKIAEQLEVKGLFDMTELKDRFNKIDEPQQFPNNNNSSSKSSSYYNQSSPVISTSTNVTSAQSSSSSPPYSYKSPYSRLYSSSPVPSASERMPQWPTHLPSPIPTQHLQSAAAAMLGSVYDSGSDMNPLKRKKLSSISSMLMSRDTPILRNVLAQPNAADSSQPVPLVCQSNSNDRTERHNGNGNDYSNKNIKYEEPHSPYTDKSFEDDSLDMSQNYSGEPRLASYVPQQKPEWKRYKQYTRNDILSAIECVRNGMSALQASRKYGVPSRTLYDKVKKLKITTGRPMNRTIKRSPSIGNNSPAMFPYGLGTTSPYNHHNHDNPSQSQQHSDSERDREMREQNHHHMQQTIPHPAAALLDANFLQHALEGRGGDITGREALHAMAIAAAAHAAVNGISTSPGTHGTARSPSPGILMKYMRTSASPDTEKENNRPIVMEDEVEDLSMARKEREMMESPPQQQGVIVPPMTKVSNDSYNEIKREIIAEDDNRD